MLERNASKQMKSETMLMGAFILRKRQNGEFNRAGPHYARRNRKVQDEAVMLRTATAAT